MRKITQIRGKNANTHEASGVGVVGADLPVNLDKPLLDDASHFTAVKSILEAVAEKDGEGEGFAQLVGARRRAGGVSAA